MIKTSHNNVLKMPYIRASTGTIQARVDGFQRTCTAAANDEVIFLQSKGYPDHLNSITAVSNEEGILISRQLCDAWGTRITPTQAANDPNFKTDRGYTGHQMLDELGLTHMNGRLYDPLTARFISADPLIDSPNNLQSFNRYSYVHNNPLRNSGYTDPTGYSPWTQYRSTVAAIAVAWVLGPAGYFGNWVGGSALLTSGAAGFAAGGVSGGNLNSALNSAFSAMAFNVAGDLAGTHGLSAQDFMTTRHVGGIAAHAAVGCAAAAAAGGSCKGGAASAGFSMYVTPGIAAFDGHELAQITAVSIAGGIGAQLGGGSFESGAVSGAFGYLFNQAAAVAREIYDVRFSRGTNSGANKSNFPDEVYLVGQSSGKEIGPFEGSANPNITRSTRECDSGKCPVSPDATYRFTARKGFNDASLTGGIREMMLDVGTIDTVKVNPKNKNNTATGVWIHSSFYYTNGCFVIEQSQWSGFVKYFKTGDPGSVTLATPIPKESKK